MVYMKHAELGNRLVPESEVEALRVAGWVKWPRTLSEKLGIPLHEQVDTSIASEVGNVKVGRRKRK